ncbi:MAG: mercury methylation corrinoid protein HgcA [Sedimentibacter sp.]
MDNKNSCSSSEVDTRAKVVKINVKKRNLNNLKFSASDKGAACSCGGNEKCSEPITKYNSEDQWIIGEIKTDVGIVPQISTQLTFTDIIGTMKARCGIGRMNYKINPGIYAVGTPDCNSNVLVTANYKLTFDALRKELIGLNIWILVLDTKGINVWCAAGKGTFGTKELISRINRTRLSEIVSHRTLILPQLGAPGVISHDVTRNTGFKIIYGPVRAVDIKTYINSGYTATPEMRQVKFTTKDRLILTPMEISASLKPMLIIFGLMFLVNLISINKFGLIDFYASIGVLLIGCVITPTLLPWIPGRAFALKGWILGLLLAILLVLMNGWLSTYGLLRGIAYLLILPSVTAFLAMNFTGSSTYTSFSGVLKEMKVAIPVILITISLGTVILLISCFI